MTTALHPHAGHDIPDDIDVLHGDARQHLGAGALGGVRQGLRGEVRVGLTVTRRLDATDERVDEHWDALQDLLAAEQARLEAEGGRSLAPRLEGRHLLRVVCKVDVAGGEPAHVLAELVRQACPQAPRLDGGRDLAQVAPVLPHPSPVAARLLAGDPALLQQCDPQPAAREVVRGAAAHDAAAHHHHVCRFPHDAPPARAR